MSTLNPVGVGVRRALVLGIAATATLLGAAPQLSLAQDADAAADDLTEVVVTGSRIARPEVEATTPIVVLDSSAFDNIGVENFADLATQLPGFAPAFGSSRTQSAFSGSVQAGLNEANLRNLGSQRTLVLINGRRAPGGTPIFQAVDFNTIPTANIDRVEVITGGAAAIYGADAVAGVINVITKKNFEGIEFGASYGEASEGDNRNPSGHVMIGGSFGDRGRGLLTVQLDNQGLVSCRDRFLCAQDIAWFTPPNFIRGPGAYSVVAPAGRFLVGGTAGGGFVTNRNGTFVPFDVTQDGYNRNADRNIAIPTKRVMVAAEGEFQLTDNVTAFLEANYGQSKTSNTIEGQPFQSSAAGNLVGGGPGVAGLEATIPITNPFIPAAVRTAYLANNPTGTAITWNQRFNDIDFRGSTNDRDVVRVVGGLKGDFSALERDFNWEVSHVYGRTTLSSLTEGLVGTDRLFNGLRVEPVPGVAGQFRCADPAARALGCVPINPFAPYTQAMKDYLKVTAGQAGEQTLENTLAFVSGSLFSLPAGEVRTAVGIERRVLAGSLDYDELINRGLVTSNQILDQPEVETQTEELFAEVLVPVLADKPFAKVLSLEGAFRTTDADYLAQSISYDTWKLGGEWAPIEGLRFRAMRARSVRAPQVDDLVGGSQTFGTIQDPCGAPSRRVANPTRAANCIADGIPLTYTAPQVAEQSVAGFVGRNPNLQPEESRSVTFGFAFTPSFAPGLLLSVDRFEIDVEGIINTVGRQIITNRCYDTANRQDCNLLTRGVSPNVLGASWVLLAVNDTTANLATQDIAGYDINLQYQRDFGRFGKAGARLLVTRYDRADLYTSRTAPRTELLGFAGGSTDDQGFIKTTANLNVDYQFNNFGVNWNTRFIGSAEMSPFLVGQGFPGIGSHAYHNVRFSYDTELFGTEQTQFFVGLTNAFDKKPPFFASNSSGTQALDTIPGYYDIFGRQYFAGVRVRL
jgi:outer membrane receptor protein involved in Fe transport